MKKPQRIIALLLAAAAIASLTSCGKPKGGADANVNLEGSTVKMVIMSHPSWPYEDGWKVFQYMREAANVNIDVQAIPATEFYTKIPLIFATPKDLPDLVTFDNKPSSDTYAVQGALVALDDYADDMPNYKAFLDTLPEEERTELLQGRKAADGKIYYAPVHGLERQANVKAWLYRKDIFDKNGLEAPKTMDDLYDVCVKLKELYPESYPFCMRSGFTGMNTMAPSWKPYFAWNFYYDFDAEKWCYGACEDTMLEMVKYMLKLSDAKLIPPDFLTINSKSWEELVTTDRGFIMPEYQTRIDFFNPLGKANNPDFNLTAMIPPYVDNGVGVPMISKFAYDVKGFVICNMGDEQRIRNDMRFIDWLYTDEACELLSWGKEGETYEVVDGKKKYILDDAENSAQSLYGFMSYGAYLRFDPEAAKATSSEALESTTDMVLKYTEDKRNPIVCLGYNDAERAVLADKGTALSMYVKEMLSKFLLKQEPLSKWDEFKSTIESMGLDELLKVYEEAYNRVK